ncbi:MAG: ribosomal-protein-alanine N-acetyltransferase [Ruminococcaceae bacterium]|nr:ribosomal-protein-alanine N-acetyltransferase [Oscillospiraceae bacterium]
MNIKKLDISHLEEVSQIENKCFNDPWSIEMLEESFENGLFFGYFSQDLLCGYILIYFVLDEANIMNVAVLPEFRKNGYGDALVKYALKIAKEKECVRAFLEVRQSNIAAQTLYQKNSFVIDGIRKNYYSNPTENAILMHCEI